MTEELNKTVQATLAKIKNEDKRLEATQEAWVAVLEKNNPLSAIKKYLRKEAIYRRRHVTVQDTE